MKSQQIVSASRSMSKRLLVRAFAGACGSACSRPGGTSEKLEVSRFHFQPCHNLRQPLEAHATSRQAYVRIYLGVHAPEKAESRIIILKHEVIV